MVVKTDNTPERKARLMRHATRASVGVAFTLILIKVIAYAATGSVALLSSLIDSILDAFASTVNLLAVRHALTPADADHGFGHGKAEPLASLGQAAFIIASSVFLVYQAVSRLVNPQIVDNGTAGIVVIFVSLALTIALVRYQKYVVAQTNSLAVAADSVHYVSDVVLNLSVIIALVCSAYLGLSWADPLFALGIAAYIVYSAWTILISAYNQLMDRELPDADRERIARIAQRHPEVRSMHQLRTRASGKDIFIQLHLELDGEISLHRAHSIADEVEHDIREVFPGADILIHQDPYNDDM